jgi:hypothetical protein
VQGEDYSGLGRQLEGVAPLGAEVHGPGYRVLDPDELAPQPQLQPALGLRHVEVLEPLPRLLESEVHKFVFDQEGQLQFEGVGLNQGVRVVQLGQAVTLLGLGAPAHHDGVLAQLLDQFFYAAGNVLLVLEVEGESRTACQLCHQLRDADPRDVAVSLQGLGNGLLDEHGP